MLKIKQLRAVCILLSSLSIGVQVFSMVGKQSSSIDIVNIIHGVCRSYKDRPEAKEGSSYLTRLLQMHVQGNKISKDFALSLVRMIERRMTVKTDITVEILQEAVDRIQEALGIYQCLLCRSTTIQKPFFLPCQDQCCVVCVLRYFTVNEKEHTKCPYCCKGFSSEFIDALKIHPRYHALSEDAKKKSGEEKKEQEAENHIAARSQQEVWDADYARFMQRKLDDNPDMSLEEIQEAYIASLPITEDASSSSSEEDA